MPPSLNHLATALFKSPVISAAMSGVMQVRDAAVRAQEGAMTVLNIPSAADIERLTRRVRSVSQRLEGIEDGVDRLDLRIAASATAGPPLAAIEARLDEIAESVAKLGPSPDAGGVPAA